VHSHRLALSIVVLTLVLSAVGQGVRGEEASGAGQQARFFEREIRPILAENCFKCHGEAKKKGGLRLDSRAAILKGGDSGPAVVPGKPAESLLIEAVHYGSIEMPPSGQLGRREVAALEAWVKLGAPWPSATPDVAAATGSDNRREPGSRFTKADRAWWAFQPVREPRVVVSKDDDWSRNPIDRFIWRELKNQKLAPAPEADKNTLIRRLSFDMLGLPPDPKEIDAFLSDESPDAYESLVDRLLASRHYGEHWARHWLDLVRYADSDGYRVDHFRPNAWLYRDYVIQSLNADKPYDRFVREQIAGDELYPGDKAALIATGYIRHGIYEYNGLDVPGQWAVILNDITDTTGDVFLGLGLQCARCHDHKFDPILQKDYYRLQAFFAPIMFRDDIPIATREEERQYRARMAHWEKLTVTLRDEIEKIQSKYREQARIETIAKFPEDTQALIAKPVEQRTTFEHQIAELAYRQVDFQLRIVHSWATGDDKVKVYALREKLKTFDHEKPKPPPIPLAVADVGPKAPPVTIPRKGSEDVAPGFLSILDDTPARISPIPGVPNTTGRRAALARC